MTTVAIVILNWNGKKLLEQFLPEVINHSKIDNYKVDIVVADNGSTDGSSQWLKDNHKDSVRLIQLEKNYGFTGGYNRALKQVEAEYYLILNSDVKVEAGWLNPLIMFMEETPNAAACMPKILDFKSPKMFEYAGASGGYLDFLGYPFCRGRILSAIEQDTGQYDDTKEIFWATGACLLVRSKEFLDAGGFDEDFFAHMEEIDLCWRLKRKGFSIWCVPKSKVFHVGGATLSSVSPRKVYFNHRNNLLMLLKNLSKRSVIPVIICRLFLDILSAFGYAITGRPQLFWSVIKAHLYFLRNFGETLKKRKELKHPKVSLYKRSIIFQYFIMVKRRFSCLPQ